jgi:PAS domain S-box-containing protein
LATEAEQTERREALIELTAGEELPILLVDDLPENLRTLEAVLAPLGIPLRTATSGYQALRMLLEEDFAMILLDVRMPGLDGLETARLVKGRSRTRDIPIVFLTAGQDELGDILRGYGVGAVDYVLKPFDAELLRSKVAVFAELERSRRALKRSEAFLRGAFEAAPVGKTVLDGSRRIVLANPAFGRLLGSEPHSLTGIDVSELCEPEDRPALSGALDRLAGDDLDPEAAGQADVDLRLRSVSGSERWVGIVASTIERTEIGGPLLLIQWVDLSARRRVEQARAELLLEQSARTHAEAIAERLNKLQALAEATETLSLSELLPELAARLGELFDAELVEIEATGEAPDEPLVVRSAGGRVLDGEDAPERPSGSWEEVVLAIERSSVGAVRLALSPGRSFTAADRSLLHDAADRAALSIRRALLHEQEHRIAVELQRGLVPKQLPEVAGVELAAHYQPASAVAEVGGDWYDVFSLPDGRLGIVLGDVAGKGIPVASTMGQVRSMTRAYALMDDGQRPPSEVLTRLNRYQLQHGEGELFTVMYAIIDPGRQTVAWASAGHLPPLLRTAAETSYAEVGDGLMGIDDFVYRNLEASLGAGGTMVLYTDGLVERRGESLDDGLARLRDAAVSGPQEPRALCDYILRELLTDQRLHDDVTAVIVKLV